MNNLIISIQRALGGVNCSDYNTLKVLDVALATSIAYKLKLPTSEVNSEIAYYHNNYHEAVSGLVSKFNEKITINYEHILNMIEKIYCFRYSLVYNPLSKNTFNALNYILKDDDYLLPKSTSCILNNNISNSNYELLYDLLWRFDDNSTELSI